MTGSKTRKNGLSYTYNSKSELKKALAIHRTMSNKSIPEVKRIRMAAAIERYGPNANINAVLAGENAEAAEHMRKIRNMPNVSKKASKNRANSSKNRISKEKMVVKSNGNTKKAKKWAPVATRGRVGI